MKTFKDFLEKAGPNQPVDLDVVMESDMRGGYRFQQLQLPPRLELYCRVCEGVRGFHIPRKSRIELFDKSYSQDFLQYQCKDCEQVYKTFALRSTPLADNKVRLMKYGELPPFGPQYDPRVGALLGDDDHLYRKGLDCESAGMGIGAFAYYRRVLESQRETLFNKVIQVAEKLNAPEDVLHALRKAQKDSQFTKAIETIKAGPLQSIYINGHNPLTLLFDAVSDGLHRQSDSENLESAETIRLLLADLARRLEEALADHKEVESAVNRLLKAQSERRSKQNSGTP